MFSIFSRPKERRPLFFHTDIHCHVVPGVDDGSPDVHTSADLVERMKSWGISRILASPHVTAQTFENTPDILDPALDDLHTELTRRSVAIDLDRHAEYRIDDFFKQLLEQGSVTTLPNSYILVENSFLQEPWDLDSFLFDLKVRGLRPILAHPERYLYYSRFRPERYEEIYRSGTFLQINLLSLAGHYGKEEQHTAEKLIDRGLVDFIGTDLHNHRHADRIEEYLTTKHYARIASRIKVLNDSAFLPQ